jgi:predicted nicotinamide N-methyase
MKKIIYIIALFLLTACSTTVNLNNYTKQYVELQGKAYVVTTKCDYKSYHYVNAIVVNKEKYLKQIRKEEYRRAKDAVDILMKSDVFYKQNKPSKRK